MSRIFEHRLNDVRMSIFGTPALDLNQDTIIDATTVSGSGVASDVVEASDRAWLKVINHIVAGETKERQTVTAETP